MNYYRLFATSTSAHFAGPTIGPQRPARLQSLKKTCRSWHGFLLHKPNTYQIIKPNTKPKKDFVIFRWRWLWRNIKGWGKRAWGRGMFWSALEALHHWERANLPGAATPVGNEVLLWLLKSKSKPRPLKDLYRSSRFSEPTIRNCLRELSALGYVALESSCGDMRTRHARTTPKLELKIVEYRQRFQELAEAASKESLASVSAASDGHAHGSVSVFSARQAARS